MGLTPKHRAFVNEYLISFNGTLAYQKVYGPKSPDVAAAAASRLLRNVKLADAIDERLSENAMRPAEVLRRLGEQARNEQSAYLTPYGVDMNRLIEDGKAHLIKAVKHTANGDNIEFYDAQAALVQLGKAHGLFVDKSDVTVHGAVAFTADEAAEAQARLKQWKQQNSESEKSNG